MRELPQPLFDVYALALPYGHGFGHNPPVGAWQSLDGLSCGVVRHDERDGTFGLLIMRRRVDDVWTVIDESNGFSSFEDAHARMANGLKEGESPDPLPAGVAPRPPLHDLQGRIPCKIFELLRQPTHHVAAWLLNQIYLSFPNPDKNWCSDCQTENFHTRLWEAHLLAAFREQGLLVEQPHESPDFRIENRRGGVAWVEAVTANPSERYEHVNAPLSLPPEDAKERFLGPAAVRFAKTLGNKLQRRYSHLQHVQNQSFVIALADFQAPSSMTWSREALVSYLYGIFAKVIERNGQRVAVEEPVSHLLGKSNFPAGLFANGNCNDLAAVIFSNTCAISKFNRVGVSAGAEAKGLRYVRMGYFFDRTPGRLEGIPFCLDVTSEEYRTLWPQGYEPWSADLEVFHNPFARHPLPHELVPEATHWFDHGGELICESFYKTSILKSKTLI
ncbi:MAG: hypothetical protein HQL94_10415, partial [Magnetococcales bacterium]|nr:hypothetical protein [Magnetococcales bacterium]